MKKLHLIFILCLTCFGVKAQFDTKQYDKICFLIGTLNEYMGYQRIFKGSAETSSLKVDTYYDGLKTAIFMESLFATDYPDIYMVDFTRTVNLYSVMLRNLVDQYYDYSPGRLFTAQMDTIYIGKLKKTAFQTEKSKLSYLLGAFMQYGRVSDGKYSLFMTNSPDKAATCAVFLKETECINVNSNKNNSIPTGFTIVFEPSEQMKQVIKVALKLRTYIQKINEDDYKLENEGKKYRKVTQRN